MTRPFHALCVLAVLIGLIAPERALARRRAEGRLEPAALRDFVQRAKDRHGVTALLFGMWRGDEELVTVAVGNSMRNVPASTQMHWRVGGITETLMTTILMQLVDRGVVTLDDKISRWLPALPHANRVNLRMLANCTSGYADYVRDEGFQNAVLKDVFREWRPQELIDVSIAKPLVFAPGTSGAYSHTDFVILGEAMEKITGKPMARLMRENIIDPLGLRNTDYPMNSEVASPVLHAYSNERSIFEDSTYWNPAWTSHSGRLTSNLHDLGKWAHVLGTGRLLTPRSHQEQITGAKQGKYPPGLSFALGLIRMNSWIVVNPRFGGYSGILAYLPSRQISIVLVTTLSEKNSADVHYSQTIFQELVAHALPKYPIPRL